MATATAIGADVVITTDGVEGITTAGGIVTTDGWFRSSKEVASAGGLFHFSRGFTFSQRRPASCAHPHRRCAATTP
jgi:hypothetical protein